MVKKKEQKWKQVPWPSNFFNFPRRILLPWRLHQLFDKFITRQTACQFHSLQNSSCLHRWKKWAARPTIMAWIAISRINPYHVLTVAHMIWPYFANRATHNYGVVDIEWIWLAKHGISAFRLGRQQAQIASWFVDFSSCFPNHGFLKSRFRFSQLPCLNSKCHLHFQ